MVTASKGHSKWGFGYIDCQSLHPITQILFFNSYPGPVELSRSMGVLGSYFNQGKKFFGEKM
jgi:hypothetical protein